MTAQLFVIGDSISIQYGPYLQQYLAEDFDYARKTGEEPGLNASEDSVLGKANGGDSSMVLAYVRIMAANDDWRPDVLLLNCGLHDIKTQPGVPGSYQVGPEAYEANLRAIFTILSEVCPAVVWVRTTPVIDEVHNSHVSQFHRHHADELRYNEIADELAEEFDVPVADLNGFTRNLGGAEVFCDHVHYTEEVRRQQAAFLAGFIQGLRA